MKVSDVAILINILICVATIGDVSPMSRIVMEPSKINVLPAIVLINDASSHVQNVNLKWIYSLNHRAVGFRLGVDGYNRYNTSASLGN